MELDRIEPTTLRLLQTEDGIQVEDSILWLDARVTGGISFLSSAHRIHGRANSQFIATDETVKLLAINHIRINALVRPYNAPIAIGSLKMELLPSGSALGGSSLYVETNHGSLLYAPHLQPNKTGITRTMQLKPAETLILGASSPLPSIHHPSRRKEKERFVEVLGNYIGRGEFPVILCEPYSTAQELINLLSEKHYPLAVSKSIYRINKVYEYFGSNLGEYNLLHRKLKTPHVKIIPLFTPNSLRNLAPLPDGPIFCIEESQIDATSIDLVRPVAERFTVGSNCDGRELRGIIQSVQPKKVFFTGPYAKQYAAEFQSSKYSVQALYPKHLPNLL